MFSKINSLKKLQKGGDMMKRAILLTIVAVLMIGTAAIAETASVSLYPGLNMIAPPLVPFTPDPSSVFNNGAIAIDLALIRWDAATQSYVYFDQWGDPAAYGNVLLGDGSWLKQDSSVTWSYSGVPDGVPDANLVKTDMWISLPKTGLTLVGNPFNHNVTYANCLMTDGTVTKTLDEARTAGWTDGVAWGWDGATQSYYMVEIDPWGVYLELEAGHAYWIRSTKDNVALIVPAQ